MLSQVDFDAYPSEVHVLAGENGAGKSTLIKILGGAFADYEGSLELDGVEVRPRSPREAAALGIAVIHQELSLIPSLGAADNLFLGRWPTDRLGLVRGREQRAAAVRALERFGLDLDPDRPVGELPPAVRQLIEIAKALDRDARVIVMDEPTSALAGPDVEELHARLDDLRARGCAVIYITHRMEEIERVADRITVLRDGRRIGSAPASEVPAPLLLRWMAGRDAPEPYRRAPPASALLAGGAERLRVEGLSVIERGRKLVDTVSLDARRGEIVGLAGLQGSGASELLAAIFGALATRRVSTRSAAGREDRHDSSAAMKLRLDGEEVTIRNPRDAIAHGIALLTNDRQGTGLVLPLSIAANLSLPDLRRCSPWGLLRPAREETAATELMRVLGIRAASPAVPVRQLSGGNQQKVALGKWLPIEPRLLLLDEPTRGVDVGAKREIYEHLDRFSARGIAIVLASSDLPELLALADRVVVLHRGRVTARFERGQATPESVVHAAMGEIA
ncbi:MAG TPA: sugar ABC transporter ATP-binding protein [Kofleriaceae bacterium]|nr:sugar ABC transporter ATP-binding protein [Kofleriaceae bacterium]